MKAMNDPAQGVLSAMVEKFRASRLNASIRGSRPAPPICRLPAISGGRPCVRSHQRWSFSDDERDHWRPGVNFVCAEEQKLCCATQISWTRKGGRGTAGRRRADAEQLDAEGRTAEQRNDRLSQRSVRFSVERSIVFSGEQLAHCRSVSNALYQITYDLKNHTVGVFWRAVLRPAVLRPPFCVQPFCVQPFCVQPFCVQPFCVQPFCVELYRLSRSALAHDTVYRADPQLAASSQPVAHGRTQTGRGVDWADKCGPNDTEPQRGREPTRHHLTIIDPYSG